MTCALCISRKCVSAGVFRVGTSAKKLSAGVFPRVRFWAVRGYPRVWVGVKTPGRPLNGLWCVLVFLVLLKKREPTRDRSRGAQGSAVARTPGLATSF